jgi:hypothetical protein
MKYISFSGSSQRTLKAIALLLVFCITDVYVLADARKRNTSDKEAGINIAPSKIILGRLFVPYHHNILVNGRDAMSGDIIFSGSRLQTRHSLPATVEIGSIAKLDIEPDTDLLLTFDQRSIDVKVAAGNVMLKTNKGVKGQVMLADGEVCTSLPTGPDQGPPSRPTSADDPKLLVAYAAYIGLLAIPFVMKDDDCEDFSGITVASPVLPNDPFSRICRGESPFPPITF